MKRILIFSGIGILVLALILAGLAAAGTAPQNTTSVSGEPVAGDTHPDTPDGAGNVAAGNNRFAFDLYRQLATDPAYAGGNLFFSPYSISSA
ncbi:serpin family protein, partial [Methanoculleus bourgensis]